MSVRSPIRRYEIISLGVVPTRSPIQTPFFSCTVAAGFPSPADDYLEQPLDFNELLIKNPAATFAVRIAGESMTGAGLFSNDIAIVNRAATPTNGSIILALLDGEFTIKRYRVRGKHIYLQAENPKFPDIAISEGATFEVWGVISHAIRML
jgi:DNA polymerase V